MAIRQVTIVGDGFTNTILNNIPSLFYQAEDSSKMYAEGKNLYDYGTTSDWFTFFNKDALKLNYFNNNSGSIRVRAYRVNQSVEWSQIANTAIWQTNYFTGLAFAVDDETEQGQIFICYHSSSQTRFYVEHLISEGDINDLHNAYLAITGTEYLVSSFGGGATHIATKTGLLSDLSSDISDILIVAGGGGSGLAIDGNTWDGSEIDILWSGNSNKMTVSVVGGSIVFILYSGATSIYTFTSPVGSAVADITKINVGFLIDNEQGVAKPSFIYNDGSDYYYNQEEPTDAQMALIYEWLQAGL